MGKSYSLDLRLRVLSALDGGMSKMQAHKTYTISRSTIDDWLTLREQTGSVSVVPKRQGKKGLHEQEGFAEFVVRHQHSTLQQMSVAWLDQRRQSVSLMSFSRALRALGYTRKKELSLQRKTRSGKTTLRPANRADDGGGVCLSG